MAQVTEVSLVDDLDGGKAEETLTFSIDGKAFEIDLSDANASKLRDNLAPFIGAARRPSSVSTRRATSQQNRTTSAKSRQENATIRMWAQENGFSISERGRIPSSVVEAYEANDGAPVKAAKKTPAASKPKSSGVSADAVFKDAGS